MRIGENDALASWPLRESGRCDRSGAGDDHMTNQNFEASTDLKGELAGYITRYDRCPTVFLSAIALAATVLFWL